jgi:hypothetical protein
LEFSSACNEAGQCKSSAITAEMQRHPANLQLFPDGSGGGPVLLGAGLGVLAFLQLCLTLGEEQLLLLGGGLGIPLAGQKAVSFDRDLLFGFVKLITIY